MKIVISIDWSIESFNNKIFCSIISRKNFVFEQDNDLKHRVKTIRWSYRKIIYMEIFISSIFLINFAHKYSNIYILMNENMWNICENENCGIITYCE